MVNAPLYGAFTILAVVDLQDKDLQLKVFFNKTTHFTPNSIVLKCNYGNVITLRAGLNSTNGCQPSTT